MYGVYTTIPVFLSLCLFTIILYDLLFVRLNSSENATKKTRKQLITISCAVFFYILVCCLAIANGICYDLFPDDTYMPFLIDRFTIIGGYIGIFVLAGFDLQILFQFSVIINISRSAVKRFALVLTIWLALTTLPLLVEAGLFAAKVTDSGYIYDVVRYIALAGVTPFMIYDTIQSIVVSMKLFELSKIKRVNDTQKLFKKLCILSLGCLIGDSMAVAFDLATFITPYRSKEYLMCFHLSGESLTIHAMCQVYLSIYLRKMAIQIIQETGKGNATSMASKKLALTAKDPWTKEKASKLPIAPRKFYEAPTVIICPDSPKITSNCND